MELLDETREFVVNYLRDHGFEVKADGLSEYPNTYLYYLRGELVGWSYDSVIYLQPVLPSLIEMGILAYRGKTEIPFDLPGIEVHDRLRDTVKSLKNSASSYDELVKKSRVQKIRQYFANKRISNEYSQMEMTV